jgi:hypothetical protein
VIGLAALGQAGSTKPKIQKEIAMSGRILVTFAALVFWLIPALAPAASLPLFACQLGDYTQFDGSDGLGNQWKAKLKVVAENIALNGQTYFHIRLQNWDPYRSNPRIAEDFLLRSTAENAFLCKGGPEWRQFSTTGTPSNWMYYDPPGQIENFTQVEVTGPMPITIPIGTLQAYENKFIYNESSHPFPPWYAYLVPGPGVIKDVDTDVDPARGQRTLVLNSAGSDPVSLFKLKTGLRLIYDASDKLGKKWQMTWLVQEQVTFGGHTYFRIRQNNYSSSIGGDGDWEFYLRSSTNQAWISYDGVTEHLAYQAASPGTNWNYPDPWDPGTDYINIASIGPINVIGGSLLAYRHNGAYTEGGTWIDYVVPGLGIARREDSDLPGPARAPLIFTLTKLIQGSATPAVNMLLLD